DIPSYEGLYQVSNLGRVKSLSRYKKAGLHKRWCEEMILKLTNSNGYKCVGISNESGSKKVYVHRLVMEAFEGKSELQVDHIDRDKSNNNLSNLRYCTPRENDHYWREDEYVGVSWSKKRSKWKASIKIEGKSFYLGYYTSKDKAKE